MPTKAHLYLKHLERPQMAPSIRQVFQTFCPLQDIIGNSDVYYGIDTRTKVL